MSDDAKLDFYLKHREQIEDWANLRGRAQSQLDEALVSVLPTLVDGDETSLLEIPDSRFRNVKLRIPGAETSPAWVELNWTRGALLVPASGATWPALVVAATPDQSFREQKARIKESTRRFRTLLQVNEAGDKGSWWVWYGRIAPADEPIDIETYAAHCAARFREAWLELRGVMLKAITGAGSGDPV